MFNIGGGELIVIMLIALIVLGPQRLPDAARQLGKAMGDLRRISSGFQNEMKGALNTADDPSRVAGRRNVLAKETAPDEASAAAASAAAVSAQAPAPARKAPLKAAAVPKNGTAPKKGSPAKKKAATKKIAAPAATAAKKSAKKAAPAVKKKATVVSKAPPRRTKS